MNSGDRAWVEKYSAKNVQNSNGSVLKAEQNDRKILPPMRDTGFAFLDSPSWIRLPGFAFLGQDLALVEGLFLNSNPGSFIGRNPAPNRIQF
jgi:hypothetical protein